MNGRERVGQRHRNSCGLRTIANIPEPPSPVFDSPPSPPARPEFFRSGVLFVEAVDDNAPSNCHSQRYLPCRRSPPDDVVRAGQSARRGWQRRRWEGVRLAAAQYAFSPIRQGAVTRLQPRKAMDGVRGDRVSPRASTFAPRQGCLAHSARSAHSSSGRGATLPVGAQVEETAARMPRLISCVALWYTLHDVGING